MQWMTMRVLFAAEIDEGRDACDSDCGIEQPFTPNAAERVRYDHTTSQLTGKFICRIIGILGEERHGFAALDVRLVDTGVCANETMPRFADQHFAAHPDDASRFTKNDFDQ